MFCILCFFIAKFEYAQCSKNENELKSLEILGLIEANIGLINTAGSSFYIMNFFRKN